MQNTVSTVGLIRRLLGGGRMVVGAVPTTRRQRGGTVLIRRRGSQGRCRRPPWLTRAQRLSRSGGWHDHRSTAAAAVSEDTGMRRWIPEPRRVRPRVPTSSGGTRSRACTSRRRGTSVDVAACAEDVTSGGSPGEERSPLPAARWQMGQGLGAGYGNLVAWAILQKS
jgi:hypothetical protein